MARPKSLNMDKFKTTLKKGDMNHKDWKNRIRQAITDGEHKSADTAIKLLTKSRDSLQKLIEHVEGHSVKAKAKMEKSAE